LRRSRETENRAVTIVDIAGGCIGTQLRRVPYDTEASIRLAIDLGMPDVDLFTRALREAAFPYPDH
jgi:hypothetical protein